MTKAKPVEKRTQVLRRQFNESFCDPNGHVMIAKVIAVAFQIVVLYETVRTWDKLIEKPDIFMWIVAAMVAPDLIRKFLNMRLGTPAK
jgi:hypothetical protein